MITNKIKIRIKSFLDILILLYYYCCMFPCIEIISWSIIKMEIWKWFRPSNEKFEAYIFENELQAI